MGAGWSVLTLLLATLFAAVPARIAWSSAPVRYVATGCVTKGVFTSGPYTYRVQSKSGAEWRDASLASHEGKTVRLDGWLSPGDRLSMLSLTVVDDRCRPELHRRDFIRQ